jgi:hypothetical protein
MAAKAEKPSEVSLLDYFASSLVGTYLTQVSEEQAVRKAYKTASLMLKERENYISETTTKAAETK